MKVKITDYTPGKVITYTDLEAGQVYRCRYSNDLTLISKHLLVSIWDGKVHELIGLWLETGEPFTFRHPDKNTFTFIKVDCSLDSTLLDE